MLEIKTNKKEYLREIWGNLWDKWEENYSILSDPNAISYLSKKQNKFTSKGKDPKKFQMISYIKYLNQYCKFNKCTPSDLLKEIDVDDRDRRVQNYLVNFLLNENTPLEELKALGFKNRPNIVAVKNQIQGKIKGFYSSRGLNISFGIETETTGEKEKVYLDKESIKLIQNKLESFSFRLINKFETQTGLRIDDIITELVKEIDGKSKYAIKKYKNHYYIRKFRTYKENITINYLFFSKDLENLIKSEFPNQDLTQINLSELIKSRKMPKKIKDENNKWVNQLDAKGNKIYKNSTVSYDNYRKRLNSIGKNLEFTENLTSHAFRIYFETQVNKLQDDRFKIQIMGVKPYYRDTVYDQNLKNIEWFYDKWLEIEKVVAIDNEIIDLTEEEMKEIRIQNLELKETLREQEKEIGEMKINFQKKLQDVEKLKEWQVKQEIMMKKFEEKFGLTPEQPALFSKPKTNNNKTCVICGEDFKPKSWNQKYCSKKCSNEAQNK